MAKIRLLTALATIATIIQSGCVVPGGAEKILGAQSITFVRAGKQVTVPVSDREAVCFGNCASASTSAFGGVVAVRTATPNGLRTLRIDPPKMAYIVPDDSLPVAVEEVAPPPAVATRRAPPAKPATVAASRSKLIWADRESSGSGGGSSGGGGGGGDSSSW